ncbi:MAG: hypothetical protein AAFR98_08195 [Pseudomonadota bacterium]
MATNWEGNELTNWEEVLYGQEYLVTNAIEAARQEFEAQGRRHRDIVLMFLNSHYHGSMLTKSPDSLAQAAFTRGACPVVVPSSSIPDLGGGPYPYNNLQYTLVHEFAHCVVAAETAGLFREYWWDEPMAEFIANLAYPNNDFEVDRIYNYDFSTPLTHQDNPYSVVGYIQSLANQIGELDAVDSLVALRGEEKSNASIQEFIDADLADSFLEYAYQSWEGRLVDTGGSTYPAHRPFVRPTPLDGTADQLSTEIQPLSAAAFQFNYDGNTKLVLEAVLGEDVVGGFLTDASNARTGRPKVTLNPVQGCDADNTNTQNPILFVANTGNAAASIEINVIPDGIAEGPGQHLCDSCLLGTWRIMGGGFDTSGMLAESMFEGMPSGTSLNTTGRWTGTVVFRDDGRTEWDISEAGNVVMTMPGMEMVTSYRQSVHQAANWSQADGYVNFTNIKQLRPYDFRTTMSVNGISQYVDNTMAQQAGRASLPTSSSSLYDCDASLLSLLAPGGTDIVNPATGQVFEVEPFLMEKLPEE